MSELLSFVVLLLVAGGIAGFGWWALDTLGVPDPINRVGKVVIVAVALIIIVLRGLPMLGVAI